MLNSSKFQGGQTVFEILSPAPPVASGLKGLRLLSKIDDMPHLAGSSGRVIFKANIKLIDQIDGVVDDAFVHFGPAKFDVIKPGAGGTYFSAFRYGDIKGMTPGEVEGLIGNMARSGQKGSAKVMHVVDDAAKADEFGTVPGTKVPEFTIEGEQKAAAAFEVQ